MAPQHGRAGVNPAWPAAARQAIDWACDGLGLVAPAVTPLTGGIANQTLRLRDSRHDVVLRVAGAPPALGPHRASERAIHRLAADAGLAPQILLSRPDDGWLVTSHVPGHELTREAMHDAGQLARVGRWIAGLHALSPPRDLPVVDIGARAAAFLDTIGRRAPSALVDELARRLRSRRDALPGTAPVPCHHDLHHRNFIDAGDRLWVVDWEYAGPGDGAADLAACIRYHDLGPREADELLAGYGRRDAWLRGRVSALCWIFDCLWFGWNAVGALEGLLPEPELQERLAARLIG